MNLIEKCIKAFYWLIIVVLFVILVYSSAELILLVVRTMLNKTSIFDFSTNAVDVKNLFVQHVQGFIAGILLLTIILELIQSFFVFLKSEEHSKYLIIIYEIAMIAIVRHLFAMDFEHTDGMKLLGISVLVLVLGALNFINKPFVIKRISGKKTK
ncbi:phosphate-starvation-inducible PsiE family protein [Litoribaculum gwangyangense]|uniref:Protein PsiE n=1 Tax=Litoribaculum gwangyangense TaxID=1130722 RepID=A0ABP9CNV0_9FLAO